jgi:hypothetical protein
MIKDGTDSDTLELEMHKIEKFGRESIDLVKKQFLKAPADQKMGLLNLMARLGDESFKPLLLDFIHHHPADFPLIDRAIEVLNSMGESVDPDFLKKCDAAREWLLIAGKRCGEFKDRESPELSLLLEAFYNFPDALQLTVLENLARENQKESIHFIRCIWGKREALDSKILGLMAHMGTKEAGEFLQDILFSLTDKKAIKEIKKLIYRLKSKGIKLAERKDDAGEKGGFDFKLPAEEKAFVSKPDFLGERLIWYTAPNKFGWLDTFQCFVSDVKGIIKFTYIEMARKDFRDFVRHLKSDKRLTVVEIDPSEVKWLVEKSAGDTEALPEDFMRWRKLIDGPQHIEEPLVLAESISSEVTGEIREQVGRSLHLILNEEEFASWIIDFDRAMAFAQRVADASSSTVVVNEETRKQRIAELIQTLIKEYFTGSMCAVYRRRLKELAKVQKILGKNESARKIWALSEHFENAERIQDNAFARGIIERSIALIMEELKKREASALIKKPSQQDYKKPEQEGPPGLIK